MKLGTESVPNSEVSSLKLKGDVELLAYLKVGVILLGIKSLNKYLEKIATHSRSSLKYSSIYESLVSHTTQQHPLDRYLDWNK